MSKICQRLVNFCQSGDISPNLVTLVGTHSFDVFELGPVFWSWLIGLTNRLTILFGLSLRLDGDTMA